MRTFSCDILVLLLCVGGIVSLWSGIARATRPADSAREAPAAAVGPPGATGVVAVVKVPRPWYAPDFLIVRKMREAMPQYRAIPGLRFKAFTFADAGGEFGGIYLWRDRGAAQAWFTPAWYARVRAQRGVDGQVRLFDVTGPVRFASDIDWAAREQAVATLVVPPSGAEGPDERGALIVYPIRTGEGDGRLLIWPDRETAKRTVDAWSRRQGGRPGLVEWFDAPILMPANAGDEAVGRAAGQAGDERGPHVPATAAQAGRT